MYVNYTDLSRVCLKYLYWLTNIEKLVDSFDWYIQLSFMDTYSKYNQIYMHETNRDKTVFMKKRANYLYNLVPFGLKNASATYQRMVNKILEKEIGETQEVYMDDMNVKSNEEDSHNKHLASEFRRV